MPPAAQYAVAFLICVFVVALVMGAGTFLGSVA